MFSFADLLALTRAADEAKDGTCGVTSYAHFELTTVNILMDVLSNAFVLLKFTEF